MSFDLSKKRILIIYKSPTYYTYKIRCGEGRVMSSDSKGCVDRNECLDLPCLNGASCINLEPKQRYRCVCLDGFWGENCELIQEGQTLKLSMGALAAILVCILLILSEHLLTLLRNYKHIISHIFSHTHFSGKK